MHESPTIGCTKDELDTPTFCVDLDVMDANIQSMVSVCKENKIDWRPHAKCHKSSWIARRLVDAGAIGVTCAKLGEAEYMAAGGVHDLLIANLLVGQHKMTRLSALARTADVIVCVDDLVQAQRLSRAMASDGTRVRILIEVDIGLNRVGVQPGDAALALAREICHLPGLDFVGLMAYEGHLLTVEDQTEKGNAIRQAIASAAQTKDLIEQSGIACPILSCGGTGSYVHTVGLPGLTELQAGGAIFMDAFYRFACRVDQLDFAATVVSTVVSRPTADRVVIDAGRKTLNGEIYMPRVFGRDDLDVVSLSAEHGVLHINRPAPPIHVGDRIELIPGYVDLTVNLHDQVYAFRNQRLAHIIPVEARGCIR